MAATESEIRTKFKALEPVMDERLKRLWAGAEADAYGDGEIAAVERATGCRARRSVRDATSFARGRAPRTSSMFGVPAEEGRGSKRRVPLVEALASLVDPVTRGDPESPLRWTSKSTRKLAGELLARGHRV
jgi:hypothetical protein